MSNELETAWAAQEPSPEFAARVVARAFQQERRRTLRRYGLAAGALAAAAAVAVVLFATRGPEARGDVTARERIEVAIGDRAVAVLEPGAHVRWRGDVVEQTSGSVFYRVERGASFTVKTPTADAVVLGTCFQISINEERAMKKRDVSAGAIGAVAAAVVVIGVYEGKVRVSRADQSVTVRAGESATADSTGVRSGSPAPTKIAAIKPADLAAGSAHDEAELRQRLADLELEKAALEQALETMPDAKSPYDLAPEDWAKLAERGEFRYQYPCFQKGGFRPSPEQLERLGLQPSDAEAIQLAYRHSNERFNTGMKAVCAELGKTGDSDLSSCLTQIFTNLYSQPGGPKETFKHVAEIHAGKRAMPAPEAMSAEMRMLLVFSSGMGPFEAELAKTFGADEAHRIAYSEELCFQAQTL